MEEKIKKLLSLAGFYDTARDSVEESFIMMKSNPNFKEAYEKNFDWDQIEKITIPFYLKHFTEEEVDSIIVFYESSVGQKILKFNENAEDMNNAMNDWMKGCYNKMMEDIAGKPE